MFFSWLNSPQWASASSLSRLNYHSQTHHSRMDSFVRVISPTQRPLPDNTQQETSVPPAGFELAFPTSEQSQTHALNRAATRSQLTLIILNRLLTLWALQFLSSYRSYVTNESKCNVRYIAVSYECKLIVTQCLK